MVREIKKKCWNKSEYKCNINTCIFSVNNFIIFRSILWNQKYEIKVFFWFLSLPNVLSPPKEELVVLEEGDADHQVASALLQLNPVHVHHAHLDRGEGGDADL